MKLHLEIITPERKVLSEEVDSVTVPTSTGEITVLPEHENLISLIGTGELTYRKDGKEVPLALTGGFLEINNGQVNIIAEHAIKADEIQIAKAKEAKEKAEKLMLGKLNKQELLMAVAEQRKALLELRIAEKYRKKI